MKHFKSRLFWSLVIPGQIFLAIRLSDQPFFPNHIIYSIAHIIGCWLTDATARAFMPNSKSWLNNKIDCDEGCKKK
jgi:hypothetical protein